MKALPSLLCSAAGLCLAACQHASAPKPDRDPKLFINTNPPRLAEVDIALKLPPLPPLDFGSLMADEFIPPGAKVIWPTARYTVPFYVTPREKFPSTAESLAPDGAAVVGSRSEKAYGGLRHWLQLFRRGDSIARSLLQTDKSLETVWSKDSLGLAIAHFVGENRTEVLVVRIRDDRQTRKVEVRDALKAYFPEALLNSPRFEIAYRWSDGPLLVMRGMGRLPAEPYDTFGYEIAIDSSQPGEATRMHFIRGYIKEGRPREAVAQQTP